MNANLFSRARIPAVITLMALAASYADIKVGSYSWSHRWEPGMVQGIDAANQYGTGYTHLDISWGWTLEVAYILVNQDWTRAVDCLDDNPSFYAGHVSSQVANYVIKRDYPDLWTRIKAHSDAGRYDGGSLDWQEGYWSMGGDEYYLRNYFISTRFCKDNFGYFPLISAVYDCDAPAWTQPKIQNYITGRSDENPTGIGFFNHRTGAGGTWDPPGVTAGSSYKWTSDDGSMVIVGTGGGWGGDAGGSE